MKPTAPFQTPRFQISIPPGAGPDQVTVRLAGPELRTRKRGREITEGPVTVRISPTKWHDKKRRKTYRAWTIGWQDGRRRREKRSTLDRAERRAREIVRSILNGQTAQLSFTDADRASWHQTKETCFPIGKTPVTVCESYAEMHKRVPQGWTLEAIYENGLKTLPAAGTNKTCPEIFAEMIPARTRDGLSKNTIAELNSRLKGFVKAFPGQILSITSSEINTWLRTRSLINDPKKLISNKTRNHFRSAINELYRFARECGYLAKTWNPLDEVPVVKTAPLTVEIYTPEEMLRILSARAAWESDPKRRRKVKSLIPFLAIGAFAGIRHEEMCAPGLPVLDWRHIDFDKMEIHVPRTVARKIGRDRIAPMSANLAEWLTPHAKRNGPVCEYGNANNELAATAALASLKWKDNALRKGFQSYRLALVKNIEQVAEEAGTSPDRIRQNYKKLVPEREAVRYFELSLIKADIVQLRFNGL